MKLKKRDLDILEPDNSKDELDNLDDDLGDNDFNDDFNDADLGFGDDSSAPPMEKHKDLLLKLTDFQPYLKAQIMEWLGLYWSEEKNEWVRDPELKPMMNMQGARWGVNFLRTYTRDNNIITNFEDRDYKGIMRNIVRVAHYVPAVRAEDFGLENNSDILTFSNQLIHSASLVLLGAGGNLAYTKLLQTAVTRHENVNVTDGYGNEGSMGRRNVGKKGMFAGLKEYLGRG